MSATQLSWGKSTEPAWGVGSYHAMGIDNLEAVDPQGRPYNLLDEGTAITKLF